MKQCLILALFIIIFSLTGCLTGGKHGNVFTKNEKANITAFVNDAFPETPGFSDWLPNTFRKQLLSIAKTRYPGKNGFTLAPVTRNMTEFSIIVPAKTDYFAPVLAAELEEDYSYVLDIQSELFKQFCIESGMTVKVYKAGMTDQALNAVAPLRDLHDLYDHYTYVVYGKYIVGFKENKPQISYATVMANNSMLGGGVGLNNTISAIFLNAPSTTKILNSFKNSYLTDMEVIYE